MRNYHLACICGTGAGKSLVISLRASLLRAKYPGSFTLVVSPTVSLMKLQRRAFRQQGFTCKHLSGIPYGPANLKTLHQDIAGGTYDILLMSPEVATSAWFRGVARSDDFKKRFRLFVIDEVHAVEVWAGFRAYHFLFELMLAKAQVIFLTATISVDNLKSLMFSYGITRMYQIREPIYRKNIFLDIRTRPNDYQVDCSPFYFLDTLIAALSLGNHPRTVICASSMTKCDLIFEYLEAELNSDATEQTRDYRNCRILNMHSCTPPQKKKYIEDNFIAGKGTCDVVVATSLIEMGLDMTDVGCVVLVGGASVMGQLIQLLGRAGRDGQPSYFVWYANGHDLSKSNKEVKELHANDDDECNNHVAFGYFGEVPDTGEASGCCGKCVEKEIKKKPNAAISRQRGYFPEATKPSPASYLDPPKQECIVALTSFLQTEHQRLREVVAGDHCIIGAPSDCSQDFLGDLREYVDAFERGENMLTFDYWTDAHRSLLTPVFCFGQDNTILKFISPVNEPSPK
jgi:superfamily II DNA helicase RecQ